jgi:hypothetical protein
MMNLCKYKNALGIHYYRLFDVAIIDVIMTIIVALLISHYKYSFIYTILFLFILGILLHRIFCVRTTVDKLLFPNAED